MEKLCVQELLICKALYFEMTANISICFPMDSHEGVQHIIILSYCLYVRQWCMNAAQVLNTVNCECKNHIMLLFKNWLLTGDFDNYYEYVDDESL